MAFVEEAVIHLAWIDSQLEHAHGTDKRALEAARDDLIKLIWAAVELGNNPSPLVQPGDPPALPRRH